MKPFSFAITVATTISVLMLASLPSYASFPGKNGRIVFVQEGEIFTMTPDGNDIRQLTHVGPDNVASWPAWSADGKQIVFNEQPTGIPEIWLMNADGSNQHQLLVEARFGENRPSFSPDGLKVVFGRCNLDIGEGDSCGIFTLDILSRKLQTIVPIRLGDTDRSPMFSPDGKTIAFIISPDEHGGFNGVTYLVDADGTHRRLVTPPAPCLIRPDWSPDGSKLTLFAHLCNPQNEDIVVMNADGGNIRYLTQNGHDYFNSPHDRTPAWSPQGDLIVFERDSPDFSSSAIYLIKPDGTGMKAIAQFPRPVAARNQRGKRDLKKIEDGGNTPRWGVATE